MAADFGAFPAGISFAFGRQSAVFTETGGQPVRVVAFEVQYFFGEGVDEIGIGHCHLVHPEVMKQGMAMTKWNGIVSCH
ncbi:hypothetical protein D3C76_1267590 [compost metagenome]